MKIIRARRIAVTAAVILVAYVLQCAVFLALAVANIKPNLMLIITASFGFMRGPREGMFVGIASGLLIDIQYGNMIGFYALIYLLAGFASGIFQQTFFDEDIKLLILLIAVSDLIYGIVIYFLMFLLRSDFDFLYYFINDTATTEIYTVAVTLVVYPLLLFINHKLEAEEKRSASKFV